VPTKHSASAARRKPHKSDKYAANADAGPHQGRPWPLDGGGAQGHRRARRPRARPGVPPSPGGAPHRGAGGPLPSCPLCHPRHGRARRALFAGASEVALNGAPHGSDDRPANDADATGLGARRPGARAKVCVSGKNCASPCASPCLSPTLPTLTMPPRWSPPSSRSSRRLRPHPCPNGQAQSPIPSFAPCTFVRTNLPNTTPTNATQPPETNTNKQQNNKNEQHRRPAPRSPRAASTVLCWRESSSRCCTRP